MKIASIVGARPQFIKLAAVSRALRSARIAAEELIVHTGQHYDEGMSRVFFTELEIPEPHVNLGVRSDLHGEMTGRMLEGIEKVLLDLKPDVVVVYGDTNSTLAGALAAAKLSIPVAHVEAGLRSFNARMPEEINRILADHVSTWLFCPTQTAVENLRREGLEDRRVHKVGDVMLEVARHYAARPEVRRASAGISARHRQGFYLASLHRAENTDEPGRLLEIMRGLSLVASRAPVVLPLHPRTRKALERASVSTKGVEVIEPAGYFEMLAMLQSCRAVLTDSGGLQKEAYFFARPCITFRDETEWTELVDAGCNRVVGANSKAMLAAVEAFEAAGAQVAFDTELYGKGDAGQRIVKLLTGPA